MQENFTILTQRAALEHPAFPVNPWLFRIPEECPAAIMDCRLLHGVQWVLQETFFKSLPAREGPSSPIFEYSRNQASSSCGLRPETTRKTLGREKEVKREPQNSSIPVPRFHRDAGVLDQTGGIYSHIGIIDYPRCPISEMHLGKLPDPMKIQSWKVDFKTEVCAKTADPNFTMQWIKEVEIAKSIDELMISRSIVGRSDFPDYDMIDAMIASASKKLLDKHVLLRRKVKVEEQRGPKYDRFLRRRQIAYMIHEHFRPTGAYEAVQGLPDSFNLRLQNDDVQDFDVRGDRALLWASETSTEMVPEGLYKSQLQNSVERQTVLAFKIEGICKTSHWSDNENSKLQSREWNCGVRSNYQESKRKESLRWGEGVRMLSSESKWAVFEMRRL